MSTSVELTNGPVHRLPIPTGIDRYSDNILFCFFQENVYLSPPSLRIAGSTEKVGLLTDANLSIVGLIPNGEGIEFDFVCGGITERLLCNTNGQYSSSTNQFVCRDGAHATSLAEYFTDNPIIFKTSDQAVPFAEDSSSAESWVDKRQAPLKAGHAHSEPRQNRRHRRVA